MDNHDIEFTDITPGMIYHPRVIDLPPMRSETLADQIRENASEPDLFARVTRALAIAAKVARLERALDQIAEDAAEEARAAERLAGRGNVVRFERRRK